MLTGIDVASHQIDLIRRNSSWVKSYYDFVIVKTTEGKHYFNPFADETIKMCKDGKRLYGLYHFARAEMNSPSAEADHFLSHLGDNPEALLALDVEADSLKNPSIDEWSLEWLNKVYYATGKRPLLYISQGETKRFNKVCANNYGLWVAHWGAARVGDITPWKVWAIWQYHVNREQGIDMNLFNGSKEMFRKYCESQWQNG